MSEGKAERGMDRRTFLTGSAAAGIGLGMAKAGAAEGAQAGVLLRAEHDCLYCGPVSGGLCGGEWTEFGYEDAEPGCDGGAGNEFWGRFVISRCARRRGRC